MSSTPAPDPETPPQRRPAPAWQRVLPWVITIACFAAIPVLFTPSARAECDISQTKCAVNGGKCNIKFRNVTGADGGSDAGTNLTQKPSAQTIKVKALKENGDKAGNALTINSPGNKTMNIDKKANKIFAKIRISSPNKGAVESVNMSCDHVKAVLNGNGTCKVFIGYENDIKLEQFEYNLGYHCDGGNVVRPES